MKSHRVLRVLHVASADLWAGAEVQTYHLLRSLRQREDVFVSALLLNEGELAERLRSDAIPVTVIDERRNSAWKIFRGIARCVRRDNIQIVHTHRSKENLLGSTAAFAARATGSLRTVHGRPEHHTSRSFRGTSLELMDKLATRLQQRIVGVSEELCVELRRKYPEEKIACVSNGIDLQAVRDAAHAPSTYRAPPHLNVAFIGRFVPVKRLDLFLGAAAEVLRVDPIRYNFIAMGDGPLHGDSVAEADRLGISDRVQFLGFQPRVLPILRQMSCLVLTSDHEGLPMVVLEALALGVPVVAPDVGGLPEVLNGIPACRLVQDRTPGGYARAIRDVLAASGTPPEHRAVSRNSLLPLRYEIGNTSSAYMSLYRAMAGQTH